MDTTTQHIVTTEQAASAFQKATLEEPAWRAIRGFAPARANEVVGSPSFIRAIADGWSIVEVWNVWTCQRCGMNDSDRDHAPWEAEHFGHVTHADRYGHESVRP